MPADVIMPMLGMAQDTGKVLRWLKREGDAVAEGEPLLEVETDKVTVEVEAPAAGTLAGLRAAEGAEVPVGAVIASVLAEGEEPAVAAVAAAPPRTEPRQRPRRPLASPKARRLAQQQGIDVAALGGSGPGGAVVAADIDDAAKLQSVTSEKGLDDEALVVAGTETAPKLQSVTSDEGLGVGTTWRTMAERTTRAWQEVPQFVLSREVDASRLQSWRAVARRKPGCEDVSHTDLLVKVCAEALRVHPRLNASWRGGALVPGTGINVGVAVATDDGLVVPVVHRADTLDLAALSARRREVVEAARAGRLRPEDVRGGTFTISNLGMYGVDAFQAIVNAPQAAILAVGRIVERPVALNGEVVVRPLLSLSVSIDHRVADGAGGAEFLDTLAALVEEPAGLVA